jgi:large subunit ribosomal protein L21
LSKLTGATIPKTAHAAIRNFVEKRRPIGLKFGLLKRDRPKDRSPVEISGVGAKILLNKKSAKTGIDTNHILWFPLASFLMVMYAVIETGSKQYRVTAGDTLEVERLASEAGQTFTFDRVLLVSNDGKVSLGAPGVKGATVTADIVEHKRGPKTIAFKMKRRKGYHRTVGHRQELTVVKIKDIKL